MKNLFEPCRLFALLRRRLRPEPPGLAQNYDMGDYGRFMREETFLYSARYARSRVVLHGQEHLVESARDSGVMVAFLHYGSFFLTGGAIVHQLGLPYTAIASRRNLAVMSPEESRFWEGVHRRGQQLYGHPLFFTDQSPRLSLNWLKEPGNVLGVVLDVREHDQQYREDPYRFLGHTLFMQSGPARLAAIARVPIVPATIRYCPGERRHHLHFDAPVKSEGDPVAVTQRLLEVLGDRLGEAPAQQFYDIVAEFVRRKAG